jgi:SAM-dependent methyltransferase
MPTTSNSEVERMIECFESALEGRPNYLIGLVGLAEVVARKKQKFRAFELCQKALDIGAGNAEVAVRAKRLMSALVPRYHVPMMNDARRHVAWSNVLSRAIRPGTRALEIGTGGGMLALMAARAGAEKVTTCELDPIMAMIAREVVDRNGFADRIDVIAKPSRELQVGSDIKAPANVLFCDLFGDSLLDFEPLGVLVDARRRLTTSDAIVVPAAGAIRLALAEWDGYSVHGHVDHAAGFDIAAFAKFVPTSIRVPVGDAGLALRSEDVEALRFDFSALSQPMQGRTEILLAAKEDAVVNGVVHWIRLELDSDTILEARPEPGEIFFSALQFWPLSEPVSMRRGEVMRACVAHDEKRLTIWLDR